MGCSYVYDKTNTLFARGSWLLELALRVQDMPAVEPTWVTSGVFAIYTIIKPALRMHDVRF